MKSKMKFFLLLASLTLIFSSANAIADESEERCVAMLGKRIVSVAFNTEDDCEELCE